MGGEFDGGGEFDSLVRGSGGDRGGIGDDKSHNEFAFVAKDHGVQDVGASLERVFDGLRGDEFSRRRLDQVFLAVGDEEIVVFVHVTDVAGAEPAVLAENFTSGFGIFVVALHDARTFDKDFPIFGGANLDVGNRFAGTAHAVFGVVAGNNGRSFRQTVALRDGNSDSPEKLREFLGKWSAAGTDEAETATHADADFPIDQGVGEL